MPLNVSLEEFFRQMGQAPPQGDPQRDMLYRYRMPMPGPTFPGRSPAPAISARDVRQGLLQRIAQRLLPVSPQLDGLMSEEDISAARRQGLLGMGASLLEDSGWHPGNTAPTIGQAFGRAFGAGRQAMQGGVAESLAVAKEVQQQQQQAILLRNRQRIAQKYAPVEGETPEQRIQRMHQIYGEFVNAQDVEMITKLSEYMKSLEPPAQKSLLEVDVGDAVELVDPITGEVRGRRPKGAVPKAPGEAGTMTEKERFAATEKNRIIDDFQTATRAMQKAAEGYGVLRGSILSSAKNPATPIAMLYAYARLLDPESVVREGEIATLQKMGAVDDRVRIWLQQASRGTLPQDFVAHVKEVADDILEERRMVFQEHRGRALQRGSEAGIDMNKILADPFRLYPKKGAAPAPGTGKEPPKY